jgi:hypothetical protein
MNEQGIGEHFSSYPQLWCHVERGEERRGTVVSRHSALRNFCHYCWVFCDVAHKELSNEAM